MLEHTKKRRTDTASKNPSPVGKSNPAVGTSAKFVGPSDKISKLTRFAERIGLKVAEDITDWKAVFPEVEANKSGVMLKGARTREGLTQVQVAQATSIPQRHLSEMENGKRAIGKETAKELGEVLHVDYRVFL